MKNKYKWYGRSSGYAFNALAMLLLGIVRRATGFITIFFLSRYLSPSDLGTYAFTQSTAQTALGIGRFGIFQGLQVRVAEDSLLKNAYLVQRKLGEVLACVIIAASLTTLALVAGAPWLSSVVYGIPELETNVLLASIMFVGLMLSKFAYAVLAGIDLFGTISKWMSILSILLASSVLLGLVIDGATGAIIGLILGQLFLGFWLFFRLRSSLHEYGIHLRLYRPSFEALSALRVGAPFYLAGVFMIPVQFYVTGQVALHEGADVLGDLRVILAIIGIAQLLPEALIGPLISHITRESVNNAGFTLRVAIHHFRLLWCTALITGVSLAVLWPFVSLLIFGDSYPQAATIGPLSILPFIITLMGAPITSAILAGQRTVGLIIVGFVQAFFLLLLGSILIEKEGLQGLFIAQFLSNLIALFAWLAILKRQQKGSVWVVWMLPMCILSLTLFSFLAADQFFRFEMHQRVGIGTLLFVSVLIVVWTTVLNRIERHKISKVFRKYTRNTMG